MMTGVVNAALEASLRLSVEDTRGQMYEVEAVLDTGFNGFLTLPSALIATLGLPWLSRQQGQLAGHVRFHLQTVSLPLAAVWKSGDELPHSKGSLVF